MTCNMPSKGVYEMFLVLSVILIINCRTATTDNILLLPYPFGSHLLQFTAIGNRLVSRGHQVTMVVTPNYPGFHKLQADCDFEVLGHAVPEPDWYTLPDSSKAASLMTMTQLDLYLYGLDIFIPYCSNLLKDEELFESLKKQKFDMVLVGSIPPSRCFWVLPYRLGVPYVSLSVTFEAWLQRVPTLPSVVPFQYAQVYTENMSLWERMHNTWLLIKWNVMNPSAPILSDNFIRGLTPDKPFLSVRELADKTELWLIDSDIIVDYARPTMPNEVHIGGILTKEPGQLDGDLATFMDSATDGVIIVSFGSFDSLPPQHLSKFLEAFDTIPQSVVLRTVHGDQLKDISPKIKIMKWIPQNDLLGHPNTKLFLTHCGGNSQFQALYHAVPMIGFPSFADQHYNARRMAYHGYGIYLNLPTLQPHDLVLWIREILHNNSSYKENILKASVLFRSRPDHPLDRLADSLENVVKYGGDHLKSHPVYNLAWYEYLMLDILGIVTAVFVVGVSCLCGIICYCLQRKQGTNSSNKLKKQ